MHQLDGGCQVYEPQDGDVQAYTSSLSRTTLCARRGAREICQTVWEINQGQSPVVVNGHSEELLYVAHGIGRCSAAEVSAGSGIYVPPGEPYYFENPSSETLVVVSVCCPEDRSRSVVEKGAAPSRMMRLVKEQDQDPLPAAGGREFKYLVDKEFGCKSATQFVGFIPPSKAPFHHHTYEEAIYIVEGEGIVHTDSTSAPFGPGACIYLPRLVRHCLENPGTIPVRLMGVFHPAGSPTAAYRD